MKITIITSPFLELPPDAIGAIERRWFNVSGVLAKKGHDVVMIAKRGATKLEDEPHFRRIYIKGFSRTGSVYKDIVLDFFYSLRALWTMPKTDVLVCNTFWSPILAPLMAKFKYRKLVYNVARFPKGHLKLYKRVDDFVCTSRAVELAMLKMHPQFAAKTHVVSNPIDTVVFSPSEPIAVDSMRIGYHGRISREKGLHILAKAARALQEEFPNLKLRFIGPVAKARGGEGEEFQREIEALAPGMIEWLEPISDRAKLAQSLRECALYCYPSVAEKGETFGVSPLEAMGLGLPTVVSNLECFSDFVEDGVNAVRFNHRVADPVEELRATLKMLLRNQELREKIGLAAGSSSRQFSTEAIAERWVNRFEEILNATA